MQSPVPHRARALGLAAALLAGAGAASAHVTLLEPAALANTSYRAALRVGHGCEGRPTTGLSVQIPSGLRGAQPMPKAGWTITLRRATLDKPYLDHGKTVTEDVVEIAWTAASREAALPDAYYDEFVFRGQLGDQAGPMWFKVVQTCDPLANRWVEVPASGTSTQGLKSPAALLEVIPSGSAAHQH